MSHTVTVGLDGSRESNDALDWAADEALLRKAALAIVQVREVGPYPYSPLLDDQVERDWGERTTREAQADLARRHPGLETSAKLYSGHPSKVLTALSETSDLLVLGSRALGRFLGFAVGSVALPTVAHVRCPTVLVRDRKPGDDGETAVAEPTRRRDVVLGLKLDGPLEELPAFAFDTAARWGGRLIAVHGWSLPPSYAVRPVAAQRSLTDDITREKTEALQHLLRPWREKYPGVDLEYRTALGWPDRLLLETASGTSLVVVGRRNRESRFGARIGSVAHTVLHHADVPVAVVPHE